MVNCVFLMAKSPSDAPQHRSSGRTLRVPSDAIERSLWGSQGNWWAVLGIKKNNPFLVASMGACQKNRHSGHPTPFDGVDVARRWWTAQAMQMSGPAELPLLMFGREKRWSEAYYNLGVSYAEMHKYDKAGITRPRSHDFFRQISIHAGWIWVNSWRFIVQKDVVSVFSEFLKLPKIGVKHQTLNAWRCWKKRLFKALINYQLTVHFDPRCAEVLLYTFSREWEKVNLGFPQHGNPKFTQCFLCFHDIHSMA